MSTSLTTYDALYDHYAKHDARANSEDMTFAEWLAAALQGGKHFEIALKSYGNQVLPFVTLKRAWLNCEDPTEWAATLERMTMEADLSDSLKGS